MTLDLRHNKQKSTPNNTTCFGSLLLVEVFPDWVLSPKLFKKADRPRVDDAMIYHRYTFITIDVQIIVSSTAQSGGGSFQKRKPIREGSRLRMDDRMPHWSIERTRGGICLCVSLSVRLPAFRSVYLSVYPSIGILAYLSIRLTIHLINLSMYLSIFYLSIYLSIRMPTLCHLHETHPAPNRYFTTSQIPCACHAKTTRTSNMLRTCSVSEDWHFCDFDLQMCVVPQMRAILAQRFPPAHASGTHAHLSWLLRDYLLQFSIVRKFDFWTSFFWLVDLTHQTCNNTKGLKHLLVHSLGFLQQIQRSNNVHLAANPQMTRIMLMK